MKTIKKRYIFIVILFFLLGTIAAITIIYFPSLYKKNVIPKTVYIFGSPRAQTQQDFPVSNPQFTATIGMIKPASLHQQSITVYQLKDTKKTPVFERPFYADGFRGNQLTYTLSSDSAVITQSGSLSAVGCKAEDCILTWSNFYAWNATQKTFVLDNASHKDAFQQLLTTYQDIDKKSCGIVGREIIPRQDGLSFTELYKKYPTASYYCSKSEGLLPSNILFFLQAEKTLQDIVNGENIGSDDIRNIQI